MDEATKSVDSQDVNNPENISEQGGSTALPPSKEVGASEAKEFPLKAKPKHVIPRFCQCKFGLLLWKNFTIQKRHWGQTIAEIFLPLIFVAVLVFVRTTINPINFPKESPFVKFDPTDPSDTAAARGKYILYSPNTSYVRDNVMKQVREYFNEVKSTYSGDKTKLNKTGHEVPVTNPQSPTGQAMPKFPIYTCYKNEKELSSDYHNNNKEYKYDDSESGVMAEDRVNNLNPVLAAIIFPENLEKSTTTIKYKLRFPAVKHKATESEFAGQKARWLTDLLYLLVQFPGPREAVYKTDGSYKSQERGGEPGYWVEGFLFLQAAVDISIARLKAVEAGMGTAVVDQYHLKMKRFTYPPYHDDPFVLAMAQQLPIFIMLGFMYPIVNIAKSITYEKEKRLKETMKIMGLDNWLHWTAWFTKSFFFLFIVVALMTGLLKVQWYGHDDLAVLTYADGSLLFVFLLLYAFTSISLGFLITTCFATASAAASATGVFLFLTYIPFFYLRPRYDQLSNLTKMLSCLLSNTCVGLGCQVISMFEAFGTGIQWSTLAQGASPDDDLSLLTIFLMLITDGILYLLMAFYIEAVFPGEYGVPLPWYFPFTKWYWCNTPRVKVSSKIEPVTDVFERKPAEFFEKEPSNARAGIRMVGLTKVFGTKVAVNNSYLNFYENQVTALLGHNGAGKTTTMSMLTGLFPPTSGTAYINGYDIRTDMKSARTSLGLCPQHDVLFPDLTVEEHLTFFCLIKTQDRNGLEAEVNRMLTSMGLQSKRRMPARTLSGGQKRKLSVGIALVGGSQVVLLDEPTAGMDPGARRSTWDLITSEKHGRTIVLSTHFMDEADLLGDRIAIMAHGQPQCCGSSLFLKKKYGGGYHLTIVKEPNCQVDKITQTFQKTIPEVEVDQDIGSELSYSLPDDKSHLFPDLFEELEKRKSELGIASYGCSITQMEEVFMRVGRQVEEDENQERAEQELKEGKDPSAAVPVNMKDLQHGAEYKLPTKEEDEEQRQRMNACQSFLQQFRAMIVKKSLYLFRNKGFYASQVCAVVCFFIVGLCILKAVPNFSKPPSRDLELKQYDQLGKPITGFECNDASPLKLLTNFCRIFKKVGEDKNSKVVDIPDLEAFIRQHSKNMPELNFKYIVGVRAVANLTSNLTQLTGQFNNQPLHTPPLALNLITNTILREVTGNDKFNLHITNSPFPFKPRDEAENLEDASEGVLLGLILSFGISFLAAGFVVFLIKEKEAKSKHLQYVSGVKFPIFWLAHYVLDVAIFVFACLLLMLALSAFKTKDFSSGEMVGYFSLVILAYSFSVLPIMYLLSFFFTVPSVGFMALTLFNFISGTASILTITILNLPLLKLSDTAEVLEWLCLFFPNFNIGYSLTQLSANKLLHSSCPKVFEVVKRELVCEMKKMLNETFHCCDIYPNGYLSFTKPGIGRYIAFPIMLGIIATIVIFILESKVIQNFIGKIKAKKYENGRVLPLVDPLALEDSDVVAETERIRNTDLGELFQTETLILKDLTKIYGSFVAVNSLCLGVSHGECFGLLGVSGAGKTTTFQMLTGDLSITAGNAYISSLSVKTQIKEVQRVLGYCPQFDALIPELTGRETIRMYARLRGVREDRIDYLVDILAANLLFSEHINRPCGTYSGGNKRKLSTAIALIGSPPTVFLDEPTAGMDPVARRHLWNTISKVRDNGTSVILTTHSMDECEALCTRLAIMVNGKFRCLGPTQHLKNKFGDGYTLIAKIAATSTFERRLTREDLENGRRRGSLDGKLQPWEEELQPLRNYIESTFPKCQLKEIHPCYVYYKVPEEGVTWAQLFRKMEEAKILFNIEAYSVGQTSLEQVFLSFTTAQVNNE